MGKGQAYERKVCRQLTLWVTGKKEPLCFWRTAGSGAAATVNRAAHKSHVGDVCCTHPAGQSFADRFVVECKHGKRNYIGVDLLVYGRKSQLEGYWKKLQGECNPNQDPFLVVRENGRDEIVMTNERGALRLGGERMPWPLFQVTRLQMVAFRYKDVLKVKWRFR